MRGARAVLGEAVEASRGREARFLIVWTRMLPTDDEEAARAEARRFAGDLRVTSFYDGRRVVGTAYARHAFPTAFEDALGTLPEKHASLRPHLERGRDATPEQAPLWDALLIHPPSDRFDGGPPKPKAFSKQVLFFGENGLFWRDSFARAPVESDWFDEVSLQMAALFGEPLRVRTDPAGGRDGGSGRPADGSSEGESTRGATGRGAVRVAWLGAKTRAPDEDEVESLGLPHRVRNQGRVIVDLEAGSPLAEAGVAKGDVLLSIGGHDLFSADDLGDLLAVSRGGESVGAVWVERATGERREAVVRFGSRVQDSTEAPRLAWDEAGPPGFERALARARDERKWILLGLSGAET